MRYALTAIGAVAVLGLLGCGGGDDGDSPEGRPAWVSTERPELGFFNAHGNGVYELGLADDRGEKRRLLSGESVPGTVTPQLFAAISWSPDGRRLAFAGGRGDLGGSPDDPNDVHTIEADGSKLERVTDVEDAVAPLWSSDGETIVFTRVIGGEGEARLGREPMRGDLWSVRTDGSDLTRLVEAADWEFYVADAFSPDGSQLAVTRSVVNPRTGEGRSAIHVLEPDGSEQGRLIDQASDAAFSPDGERIAFVSDRDRNGQLCYGDRCFFDGELYVADADGSDPERLTETEALNEAHPSWLPDGSRIAYQRGEQFQNAEAMSILEVNADSTCEREILAGSGGWPWYASPAWRPSSPRQGDGRLRC